jgi:hypothetical protein
LTKEFAFLELPAGKSTSINMLTGFLEPSAGSAVVEGFDITTQMSEIYRLMGVCPQVRLRSIRAAEPCLRNGSAGLWPLKSEACATAV